MSSSYTFSPLDEIMPDLVITMIFCFPCPSAKKMSVYNILQKGLLNLGTNMPFLSGDVTRNGDNAKEISKRPGGMSLVISDTPANIDIELNDMTTQEHEWKCSYDELRARGMPMSELHGKYLMPGGTDEASASSKFIRTRISFIPGGCFVCASSSHAYVDAWGFVILMNAWAHECREVQNPSEAPVSKVANLPLGTLPVALSKSIPPSRYDHFKQDPESWKLIGLDWRKLDAKGELAVPYSTKPVINTSIFSLTPDALADIADKGMPDEDDFEDNDPIWVSPNDALIALLWRCILKARAPSWINGAHKKNSMASVAINGRRVLYPAVPMSHIGNVVFCCLTELPIKKLIAPKTKLATVALALRRSIEARLDQQVLSDAVDLAACIPDVRRLGNAFTSWFAEDLVTTSVVDLPIYDTSWGDLLGAPEFFRLPKGQFGGICSVQPRRSDGSVEVFISLEEDQMTRLRSDEEFVKFAKFVSQ